MVATPPLSPELPRSNRAISGAADKAASGVSLAAVSKVYASPNGAKVEALRGVELDVGEGEFVCLVGASGCGKSTLLRIVAGFETATSGSVCVRGQPVEGPGPDRGVVFQDYGLFPWLTVAENIANDPAVLLMDEPFGALDSLTRQSMQDELRRVSEELDPTVILVTHSVEEAVYLADRVVVMTGGPNHGVPGHIDRIVSVPLAHPRDVTAPDFNAIKRELLGAIHRETSAVSRGD
jgi:ABC-type nitrate/sulfonate/bicarbonate transport system ATPase subunit